MLRTKKIILLVTCFLLAGIVVFTIAHNSGGKDKQSVTLYFLSADKSTITGYEEEFSEEDTELLYKAVAESLIKGPKSNRYTAVMESDTELKSIKIEDGKLTVDFSKNFKKTERLAVYAVIKTFSQLQASVRRRRNVRRLTCLLCTPRIRIPRCRYRRNLSLSARQTAL